MDFFLVLSGFVMGYAYDDRWGKMSVGAFFKRRLIRLHPMLVMGAVIGVVVFIAQGCNTWAVFHMPWSHVAISFALALLLLPSPSIADVRDNTEIFPLNGPHWSLFFEYIGSILYALLLRRLSYPLFAVHYPFIYLYIGWIYSGAHPFGPYVWCTPLAVAVISIVVAYLCMKFYDTPVRRNLSGRL